MNDAVSVIVIDDEPLARSRLERFITSSHLTTLLGSAKDGASGIELVKTHKPDVVLLDIQMPVMSGLTMAKRLLEEIPDPPAIIFCTAFNDYAIEAFTTNAVGYLLKPVSSEELNQAIIKAQRLTRLQISQLDRQFDVVNTVNFVQGSYLEKLPASDVLYFRAEGKSVVAGLPDREVLVDYTLKHLTEKLEGSFIRIHRSALVNQSKIVSLNVKSSKNRLNLAGTERRFVVSRRHLSEVRKCFQG